MSKVTLDIICDAALGYDADSLHDPHNELAEAYEQLLTNGLTVSCMYIQYHAEYNTDITFGRIESLRVMPECHWSALLQRLILLRECWSRRGRSLSAVSLHTCLGAVS